MKKYYEILEVHPKASREVIKKAHQVLIKKYHPDLYSGEERINAEQRIKDINEAYKILSDEFLREQYDIELEKETQFDRLYRDSINVKNQNYSTNEKATEYEEKDEERVESYKVGTFKSIMDIIKTLFQNKPKVKSIKEIKREDYIAAGLTLIIMIILGVILWFIPATNGFVRSILPFV